MEDFGRYLLCGEGATEPLPKLFQAAAKGNDIATNYTFKYEKSFIMYCIPENSSNHGLELEKRLGRGLNPDQMEGGASGWQVKGYNLAMKKA